MEESGRLEGGDYGMLYTEDSGNEEIGNSPVGSGCGRSRGGERSGSSRGGSGHGGSGFGSSRGGVGIGSCRGGSVWQQSWREWVW